jgi:flagellar biosynthetic protein FliR
MALEQVNHLLPTYLLALVRVVGVVMFAPVIGSALIDRKTKITIAMALTLGLLPSIPVAKVVPGNLGMLGVGVASELVFGIAIGLCANLGFVAAHWAGEMAGQQMGFTLSGIMDPEAGAQGSVLGDFYLVFALVVFLLINGHHALIRGLAASFGALPLLSVSMNRGMLDLLIGLLQSATVLALQLAAPLLVTMLIVDVSLGLMARVVPQINVLAMSLSVRSAVGLVVLLMMVAVTTTTLGSSLTVWMKAVSNLWTRSPSF